MNSELHRALRISPTINISYILPEVREATSGEIIKWLRETGPAYKKHREALMEKPPNIPDFDSAIQEIRAYEKANGMTWVTNRFLVFTPGKLVSLEIQPE